MLLPSELWSDLERVLADLAADGFQLEQQPFRDLWEWRFPPLLRWSAPADGSGAEAPRLELRPALEPWPLICDVPQEGGFTSRFVDASLLRFEVVANAAFQEQCVLTLNGRRLRLEGGPLAVRYRHSRLYPCLHPAIAPHLPLQLRITTATEHRTYRLESGEQGFVPAPDLPPAEDPVPSPSEEGAGSWWGKRHPGDVTVDLRLD